jgi:Rps23 Pro-64 3,4-dihydroxylase Tpa1-like proline 4-hydroxylase
MQELAPGIVLYSDVIKNYSEVRDRIQSTEPVWEAAKTMSGEEKEYRDTDLSVVKYKISENTNDFAKYISRTFSDSFEKIEKEYMASYKTYCPDHTNYAILRYGKGQYFTDHIDDFHGIDRRISSVYYLNDNFTGGVISFPRFNISYQPVANELLLFPSAYVYNHSISPVEEGTRYSVVSWMK